jgi:hypothetical protein
LSAKHSPDEGIFVFILYSIWHNCSPTISFIYYLCIPLGDTVPEEICISVEQNRKEIEEALPVLSSRTYEQHRRLDDLIRTPVTSFEIGMDMISFFDWYCNKSNAGNDGCSKKTLLFAEAVTKAVSQKPNAVGENPAEILLKVRGNYGWQSCNVHNLFFSHFGYVPGTIIFKETH